MYPGEWAAKRPDEPAVIMGDGETLTWAELDARSNQFAHLLRRAGLERGDHAAILMENHVRYLEVMWAALRAGLHLTPINWHLTAEEAAYIVDDCEARVLVTSAACADAATGLVDATPRVVRRLMIDGVADGYESYEEAVAELPTTPIADESLGEAMFYSSGTTGRPKGVLKELPEATPWLLPEDDPRRAPAPLFGFDDRTVYLCPAPLYHAAPMAFVRGVHANGGTVVVMERFDARWALEIIEREHITHSQWVPTMFIRLLDLPEEVRTSFDLSSHQMAIHAAAPCPVAVKHQMMDWWGPIIWEYYAGSEGVGITIIPPDEWLAHPGSVGHAGAAVVVLDENDDPLPAGETGRIFFVPTRKMEYKGDPDKTAGATSKQGYITLGDIGHIDGDGYLFLTDRASFMIISGGVNIYPREAEDVLIGHPAIADVAVFGVPHPDLGEEVKAAVELHDGFEPGDELAADIMAYCREHLSAFKCPRSVDFEEHLPRLPTGKLYKQQLRARYWPAR